MAAHGFSSWTSAKKLARWLLIPTVWILSTAVAAFPCDSSLRDDWNDRTPPYTSVRPTGNGGSCFAHGYRKGGMFLLLLKKWDGFLLPEFAGRPLDGYTTTWYPLGPVNEQLRSSIDPWIGRVREQARVSQGLSIVFRSRAYQTAGPSFPQWWEMGLPAGTKVQLPPSVADTAEKHASCGGYFQDVPRFQKTLNSMSPDGQRSAEVQVDSTHLRILQRNGGKELFNIPLPRRGDRWNYPTSIAWSPEDRFILVGAQAGSSDSHFEDYWLLDLSNQSWRHAGGGNTAKWSLDGSMIAWTTPRELAPLGRINVWVAHLVVMDVASFATRTLTSGVTYESDFYWCGR